jgi:O-antigen/teichoic acid export membrane protein
MFKNIFRTFVSRIIAALLTFGVVFITSRALGPANYGTIGLVMVAVGIILLFSALIGGTSLVYFTSRFNPRVLFSVSTLWGFVSAVAISLVMAKLNLYPKQYFIHVFLISLFANISQNLMFIILGKERILQQNMITLIQVFIHFIIVIVIFHGLKKPAVDLYLLSVLISHVAAASTGFLLCRKEILPFTFSGLADIIREFMKYGFWVQVSAFVQLFNYRLSYYLVDWFLGRQMLGIYTLAVQLAESFWILPRSVAIVQFAHISNMKDAKEAVPLSFKLMQFVILMITLFSIPIFFIPESWFLFVFGIGYTGIKSVLMLLIPAIIIFSGAIILSHYFSGIGKVWFNSITGTVGLLFTVVSGLILIPLLGLSGAALTANICYITIFISSLFFFVRFSKIPLKQMHTEGMTFRNTWEHIRKLLFKSTT